MSRAPLLSGDALGTSTAGRLPRFKYTGGSELVLRIEVDLNAELRIVGEPANACYEWVIIESGKIERHSDVGYGMLSFALRDGLIAYHGLPYAPDAAARDLAEALKGVLRVADRQTAEFDAARAALAKAGL